MTAAAKLPCILPARLRWKYAQPAIMTRRLHITENPLPCPAWPGKAEPAATSFVLCPGTGREKGGIYPASVIISGFTASPCCGFSVRLPGPPPAEHHGQNQRRAVGSFIGYTQHIAGQPTDRICSIQSLTVIFPPTKTCSPVHDGIEHHGQVFSSSSSSQQVIASFTTVRKRRVWRVSNV